MLHSLDRQKRNELMQLGDAIYETVRQNYRFDNYSRKSFKAFGSGPELLVDLEL